MSKNRKIKIKLAINVVICLLSVMALDSESVLPLIICGISATWLLLFTIANTRG
jgi:hypothetical protein